MPNIFITGAGKRMGKHIALDFARIGWNVAVHYNHSLDSAIDTVREIDKFGVKSFAVQADVREKQDVFNAFNEAISLFGNIDVLVNNAGVFPEKKKLDDISEDFWNDAINTNLRGEFFFAQAFARKALPGAKIINIASIGGAEVWRGSIPYNVSKAGVIQLTKALALELAPNISVNCVAPGIISYKDDDEAENISVPPQRVPMLRYGDSSDIFDAVRFFAESSNYITGQVLFVDGGYSLSRR